MEVEIILQVPLPMHCTLDYRCHIASKIGRFPGIQLTAINGFSSLTDIDILRAGICRI